MAVDAKYLAGFGPANVEFWGKVAELEKAGVHNAIDVARQRMPELHDKMQAERDAMRSAAVTAQTQKVEGIMGTYQRGTLPERYQDTRSSGPGPYRREFFQRVEDHVNAGMDRHKAVRQVVRDDPELHQQMLREVNG